MSELLLKDPGSITDFRIDWGTAFLGDGEAVTSSSWEIFPVEPPGGLVVDNEPPFTATDTTVFISGGIAGHLYQLTNRITTDQGRTDERSFIIRMAEK